MAEKRTLRRYCRWFAGIFLAAALILLIAGQTVLHDHLHGLGYLLFWLFCFVLTGLAMGLALLDASVTRRRAREEQQAFFEQTFRDLGGQPRRETRSQPEETRDSR